MQPNDLGPVPKHVKIAIILGLSFAIVISTCLFLYFLFYSENVDVAIVAFGAAQAAVTGLLIVLLFTFSLRMRSTNDVQRMIDRFFAEDILSALSEVSGPPKKFILYENAAKFLKAARSSSKTAEVFSNFEKGSESADINIRMANQLVLDMYVKVNIRHITVKYFFDPDMFKPDNDEEHFRSTFSQTLAGAASVGYEWSIARRYHASRSKNVLEVTLYLSLHGDTIINPTEKLFIRHDLKTMTNSFIHSLNGATAA